MTDFTLNPCRLCGAAPELLGDYFTARVRCACGEELGIFTADEESEEQDDAYERAVAAWNIANPTE